MSSVEGSWASTPREPSAVDARIGLVVELCGLPGSGKTTMAAALAAQLRSQGVHATVADTGVSAAAPAFRRLLRKALSVIAVLSASPLAEVRGARVLGSGQASTRDMVAVPVLWWVRKRVLARSRRFGGVAIVEEGLVQTLWSAALCGRGAVPSTLVALAESAEKPDVVVHVDVSPGLAVDRLTSRPSKHSRIQRLATADQLPTMRRADALLRGILDEWRRENLSDVIVVDGTATDSLERLAAEVVSHRRPPPPRSE